MTAGVLCQNLQTPQPQLDWWIAFRAYALQAILDRCHVPLLPSTTPKYQHPSHGAYNLPRCVELNLPARHGTAAAIQSHRNSHTNLAHRSLSQPLRDCVERTSTLHFTRAFLQKCSLETRDFTEPDCAFVLVTLIHFPILSVFHFLFFSEKRARQLT